MKKRVFLILFSIFVGMSVFTAEACRASEVWFSQSLGDGSQLERHQLSVREQTPLDLYGGKLWMEESMGLWQGAHSVDFGLTPSLRFGDRIYLDLGIGAHYLTQPDMYTKDLNTHFQFGDYIGLGVNLASWRGEISIQHFSNGGIKEPNPGINLYTISIGKSIG